MTTLLTIEHAQRQYLEPNDNHRKAIDINLKRTKTLAAKTLEKHGMTADFEKVATRCSVPNPMAEGSIDFSTLSVGKDFHLPVDKLEEEMAQA
jgi:hypothetical protein